MAREEKINTLKAIIQECEEHQCQRKETLFEIIKDLEQEPKLEKDGTLIVTTEYYENVGRVLVQHGTSGTLFYQDP